MPISPETSWEWDLLSDSVSLSPACQEILGSSRPIRHFDEFVSVVHQDDREFVLERLHTAVNDRSLLRLEFRIAAGDDVRWIDIFGAVDRDPSNSPVRMYGVAEDITERKLAERRLRVSEESYRALVASSTFTWTASGLGFGPELHQWLSRFSGREVGSDSAILDLVHPDDVPEVLSAWRTANNEAVSLSKVFRILHSSGTYRYFAANGVKVFDEDGTFREWIGTLNDITERKTAEVELKNRESLNRAVLNSMPACIIVLDSRGVVSALNQAWRDKVSAEPELINSVHWTSVIGSNYVELCEQSEVGFGENRFDVAAGIRKVLSGQQPIYSVQYEITLSGMNRWFQFTVVHLRVREGGAVVSHYDITDRKTTEDALKKHDAMLRMVSDTVPTAIAYFDSDCCFRFVNRAGSSWFEAETDHLMGRHLKEIIGDDNFLRLQSEIEPVLRGEHISFERESIRKSGRFIQITYSPDIDESGNVVGFFLFIVDLTESRIAEDRLRKSEEQLRQAQKLESIGRLAGGIAHDFNNMLTAINGYSELTLLKLAKDDPLRRNIEEIKKAGERSANLTQQLLAFSRRQLIEVKQVDVNKVVEDSLVMLQRVIGEDIRIVTQLDTNVCNIKGDPNQLTQVLLNLVVNSRDAMPRGGTITIATSEAEIDYIFTKRRPGSREGKYVKLSVADTGFGMDEETQKHIFEPFFTTKETGKGTGLGLSMVYGVIKQLDGYVWVTSETNGGTTFDIYFPFQHIKAEPEPLTNGKGAKYRGEETILLVEDEDVVRQLSRSILESCGYTVIEASNGIEASTAFLPIADKVDLLMTDVVMPEMSGQELAEKLTVIKPGLKVLFTSGYLDNPVPIKRGIDEGADFIQKPFSFDVLARKIRTVLDKSHENHH